MSPFNILTAKKTEKLIFEIDREIMFEKAEEELRNLGFDEIKKDENKKVLLSKTKMTL